MLPSDVFFAAGGQGGGNEKFSHKNFAFYKIISIFAKLNFPNAKKTMKAITFSPAQVHVFNLVSHIKSDAGLEQLRKQLAAFYAKQVDDEMDALWESGQWDEKRLQELRGSHFRTPYTK